MNLYTIAANALEGRGASAEEARFLAESVPLPALMEQAEKIRERFFGKTVSLCAIVNARSGACSEDCRFCAQSAHYETGAPAHPLLEPKNILDAAKRMSDSGVASFGIVTSGPSATGRELEQVASAVESISSKTGFAACASLGKLGEDQLRFLKSRGLKRYHHNLETSRDFFPSVCTTHTWDERVETIKMAKKAGLEVCAGGLFGMGETWEDRIDMALSLRELGVHSVPINFLHPVHGTPLGNRQSLTPEEGLRIIALYRFILPKATIRICGGRITTLRERQNEMFRAGANAVMTGNYLTTPGVDSAEDRAMIRDLGLRIGRAGILPAETEHGAQHARPPKNDSELGRDGVPPANSGTVGNMPTLPKRRHPAHGICISSVTPTIVFLTVCTKNRTPSLACATVHTNIVEIWKAMDAWAIGFYLLMPDHLHLFCSPQNPEFSLKSWVGRWKRKFSRLHLPQATGWQRDFWDTRLRHGESYHDKWEYIRRNPVRKELVSKPEDWPYCGELNKLRW